MKLFFVFLLLVIHSILFGQKDFFKDRKADLELGINVGSRKPTFEIGLNLFKLFDRGMVSNSLLLSSEFNYSNSNLLIAPKLTYSKSYLILNFSGSIIYYNYNHSNGLFFRPNFGFTYCGWLDLVYGYNIPLEHKLEFVNTHTITLRGRLFGILKDDIF